MKSLMPYFPLLCALHSFLPTSGHDVFMLFLSSLCMPNSEGGIAQGKGEAILGFRTFGCEDSPEITNSDPQSRAMYPDANGRIRWPPHREMEGLKKYIVYQEDNYKER